MTADVQLRTMMAEILNLPSSKVAPEARLKDLVPESFALVEMVIDMQDQLGVAFTHTDFRDIERVSDLVALFSKQMEARRDGAP